ncbi:hypothetical protein NM688_g503 [Phlebia brevispora]|uniref:Uncharacterized protein n=1 Tax=Phlebia brevispora TaxID=194682 RepID=A0ACC1TEG1_9APHY|nr:hypothetical protein NM688_g503 [Phlebia brevispora]
MASAYMAPAYGSTKAYDNAHVAGVASLVVAASLSGVAVLAIFATFMSRFSTSFRMQIMPYFVSLLIANFFQAVGTFLNVRWVTDRMVEASNYCSFQGALKQAGNVGMALWSFVLSFHVFKILFMRSKPSVVVQCIVLVGGWLAVAVIVMIGPLAVQTEAKGRYFGPSGYWCWITDNYPHEQFFLEYFFEFLSAGLSFVLYIGILLRVRGNLIHSKEGWRLRFVPRAERWKLAINRDWLDSSMLTVAARLLWHPISYAILLLPISLSRLYAFSGREVPFWATILSDVIFDLQGFVNAILLYTTHRLIPDPTVLPTAAPRKAIDLASPQAMGITPFILSLHQAIDPEHVLHISQPSSATESEVKDVPLTPQSSSKERDNDVASVKSSYSVDSQKPLTEADF